MSFVYLMIRISKTKAKLITFKEFSNARKIERKLHKKFKDCRFDMSKGRRKTFFKNHIKIGISRNPETRLDQVNKNIFDSGKTEWFRMSDLELAQLQLDLWYMYYKDVFNLFWVIIILLAATFINLH